MRLRFLIHDRAQANRVGVLAASSVLRQRGGNQGVQRLMAEVTGNPIQAKLTSAIRETRTSGKPIAWQMP